MKKEIWKDIDVDLLNINGELLFNYEISTFGRVRRKLLNGYRYIGYDENNITPGESRYTNIIMKITEMSKDGIRHKSIMRRAHRIVATHFIRNYDNKEQVNHKDRNKHNNHIDNLEWCSAKENCNHRENTKIG